MRGDLRSYPKRQSSTGRMVSFAVSEEPAQRMAIAPPLDRRSSILPVAHQPIQRKIQRGNGFEAIEAMGGDRKMPLAPQSVHADYESAVLHPYPLDESHHKSASYQSLDSSTSTVSTQSSLHVPQLKLKNPVHHLGFFKWGTMTVAVALFAAAFATYGWTVSLEQRGNRLSQQLEKLRSNEAGMKIFTTGLGAEFNTEAQKPSSGLHLPAPGGILTLELMPSRPSVDDINPQADVNTRQSRDHQPKGY